MGLDHIFLMTDQTRPEEAGLFADKGLREAYRREHPGQGTRNICYAFPEYFLEQLWVDDPVAAASAPIRLTHLEARSRWRETGACPIGIAWRGEGAVGPTWPFRPPYLPEGRVIDVVEAGPDQPMMFTFPGTVAPRLWPEDRHGGLQAHLGLGGLQTVALVVPDGFQPSEVLHRVLKATGIALVEGAGWGVDLRFDQGSMRFCLTCAH